MRCLVGILGIVVLLSRPATAEDYVVYEGDEGPGAGKHVVLLSGDEEYRSEEALVQLGKILAFRHGFKATVLFAIDPKDGTINPDVNNSLPGAEQLDSADAIVMGLRFRRYPDDIMKHFAAAYLAGKPIVGIRTSTHAFNFRKEDETEYRTYSFRNKDWPGGFGRQVLGETWVTHLGKNHKEATLAIAVPGAEDHPLLKGVGPIFATSGAYTAAPMEDSTLLMNGQVLSGMTEDSPLETGGKNDPLQPVAWAREHKNKAGVVNRVLCTTMGAAPDLLDEDMRRLLVNGVYWGLEMDVPAKADVRVVGKFDPSDYSFKGFRRGVKPADLAMTKSEALAAE